ncbi:AT hook motif family [Fusarium denticulatum]|uniref:AT hook motif family n=1 Tax=Fusarium denticulatum TaxID=48507 RepID=A0A8H5TM35_9HYPO|nr:AT hook motif family [Fusarium denticulatum]
MSQINPRPEPPVVEREDFSLTKECFCASIGNVERVNGSRLRELFWPETLRLKRDQKKASDEARELFKKKSIFAGQLRHYGISFHPKKPTVGELKELLMNAVAEGQISRQSMEQALQPLYEKWQQEVQHWDTNDRRKRLDELNKCKTPGEKASYDLDLFLEHYFTTNGQPDHHKTPDPLSLEGFDDRLGLNLRAGEVPGFGVDKRARALEAEKHEKEMKWTQAMEAHEQFVSTLKPPPPSRGRKPKPSFNLGKCQGSYIVKCDPAKGNSLRANFDFGIITGAMLLSNDEETLDDLVGSDDGSETEDSNDSEDEETKKGRKRSMKKNTKGANKGRPVKK